MSERWEQVAQTPLAKPQESADVAIIGAGPAGLTAAAALRKLAPKATVVVLERDLVILDRWIVEADRRRSRLLDARNDVGQQCQHLRHLHLDARRAVEVEREVLGPKVRLAFRELLVARDASVGEGLARPGVGVVYELADDVQFLVGHDGSMGRGFL